MGLRTGEAVRELWMNFIRLLRQRTFVNQTARFSLVCFRLKTVWWIGNYVVLQVNSVEEARIFGVNCEDVCKCQTRNKFLLANPHQTSALKTQ